MLALTFLEDCERLTLRSLVRKSAEHRVEVTVGHAKRVFSDCHISSRIGEHLDWPVQLSSAEELERTRNKANALGEKRIPGQGVRLLVSCTEHR
jgi:hypothetical protein